MYLATQAFRAALKNSHTVRSYVTATVGRSVQKLEVISGAVTQDYDDTTRRSMNLTVVKPTDLSDADMKVLVDPYRSVIRAYRGITFSDGTEEVPKLGTFYPTGRAIEESVNGAKTYTLNLFDRSVRCQGDGDTYFYISPNQYVQNVTPILLNTKSPGIVFNLGASAFLTPSLVITPDMDRWDEARRLHISVGQDLYFDRDDVGTSRTRALLPESGYSWFYDESNSSDFWDVKRDTQNDGFPNVVNVIGTNPSAPNVVGQAKDTDPNSPTYFGNGVIAKTYRSEQITTVTQANEMARYLLGKLLGPQDQVTFSAIPNPLLDVGDTIMITRSSQDLVQEKMIVSHIELPMTATESMTITCRRSIITNAEGAPVRQ